MIIKGNRHSNGVKLARYMMTGKDGERAELGQLRGFASDNIVDAFRDVHNLADATKAKNPFFHVQVRLPEGERITRDQWEHTADRIQKRLGLEGQPRVTYFHIDEMTGEEHMHLALSLIDEETLHAKAVPFFKMRLKALSRELENEFDITRVQNEREGPIKYAATKDEQQQAQRLGFDKDEIRNTIRACWDRCDNGRRFEAELAHEGLILAQGDQRNLVVVDHAGGLHALGKRILDVNKKVMLERMADHDLNQLPSVEQARDFIRDISREHQQEKPDVLDALKQDLAEVNKLIASADPEQVKRARLKLEHDEAQEQIEALNRATVGNVKRDMAEIDQLIVSYFARHNEHQEKPAPVWDRDRANNDWQDAVIDAAIEKEKIEGRFAEPKPRETRARQQGKEQPRPPAPELGKTQGEIRLARSLTDGPQGFANALEDRGFILARITPDDIKTEMEQLRKEWEQRRRDPQTWMEHEGGFSALNPELQDSARRSYDEWNEARDKEKQKQFTVEDYVDFVQKKWLEGPKSQLERATGELAVIAPFGSVYTLTPRNTGLDRDELREYLKGIDRAALLSVTDAQAVIQDVREHQREEWLHNRREEWLARQPLGRTSGEIRLAYSLTQTGQEFASAIEDRGSILACMTGTDAERLNRWERQRLKEEWKALAPEKTGNSQSKELAPEDKYRAGELVVVNQYGQIFQLTQHNTGHDIDARAERLKDIDRAALLSVTAAQGVMKNFQQHRQEERQKDWQQKGEEWLRPAREEHWPTMPPQPERKSPGLFEQAATEATRDNRAENLKGVAAHVWTAWRESDSRKAFAAALDDKGIAFAVTTKEEADRSHSKEAAFARAVGNYVPRFKEGEIVIVTEARPEYRRDGETTEPRSRVHKVDQSLAAKFIKGLDNRSSLQGIDATKQASDQRAQQRSADWQAIGLERATNIRRGARTRVGNTKDNLHKSPAAILKPVDMGLNVIGKPLKLLEDLFEGLFAPKLTPEQIAARDRQADAREQEQREAAQQRERERDPGGRER